jgi:hypothetical protein
MRKVVNSGGFTRFRRATDTPFNLVYEARRSKTAVRAKHSGHPVWMDIAAIGLG